MYWEAVLTEPLGKPKWSARNQRAKTTKLTERSHCGRSPDNGGAADSTREPGRALDPELRSKREVVYEELHRAILRVCDRYPGLTKEIAAAILPFEKELIWLTK